MLNCNESRWRILGLILIQKVGQTARGAYKEDDSNWQAGRQTGRQTDRPSFHISEVLLGWFRTSRPNK